MIPFDNSAFPLLLEEYEKDLGFDVFLITEGFIPFEWNKPPFRVVARPLGESDAIFKMLNSSTGMLIYQQKCFGRAEGEDEDHPPYWHPIGSTFFHDAASAVKAADVELNSAVVPIRREKYDFKKTG